MSTARTSCRSSVREPARPRSPPTVRFAGSAPARPAPRRRRTRGGRPRSWCPGPASTRRPTPWADRSCTVLSKWVRFRPRRVDLSNLPAGRPGRRTRGRGRRVGRVEAGRPQAVALQVPSFRPKRSRAAAVGPRLDACGQQVRGRPERLGPVLVGRPRTVRRGRGSVRGSSQQPLIVFPVGFQIEGPAASGLRALPGPARS